jgi:16S rRNA (cytidine1402-2'-O)-methyltransferase
MGTLFVVATPIGNLNDVSVRAVEILRTVDLIACEDTRQSIKLLNHLSIQKSLTSYHDFNEEKKAEEIVARIADGMNVALISDAGTPAIADPGYRLVRLCRLRGISVVAIPGANAAIVALSASGLPSDEFLFLGFLPAKQTGRREKLQAIANVASTLVFYEAPHRIEQSLGDAQHILGDREVCVARELTKIHEEWLFGKLSDVRTRVKPLGEFVVVVSGASELRERGPVTREEVLKKLRMSRNELYALFFKNKS